MSQYRDEFNMKLEVLRQQTTAYLRDIKKVVNERNTSDKLMAIGYFTYSLDISHDPEQESLCLGSYHLHNIGTRSMTNPYICIKLPTDSPFSFSGKYVYSHFKQSLKTVDSWERINEKEDQEEYWLKPFGKTSLEPQESISFSNFQIKWSPTKSYAGSIMGFTYCDEIAEGMAVLNPINLNGTVHSQEDEHE